jgi:hypothetical protein
MTRKEARRHQVKFLMHRLEANLELYQRQLEEMMGGPGFERMYGADGKWNHGANLSKTEHWQWGHAVGKKEATTRILSELREIFWDQLPRLSVNDGESQHQLEQPEVRTDAEAPGEDAGQKTAATSRTEEEGGDPDKSDADVVGDGVADFQSYSDYCR